MRPQTKSGFAITHDEDIRWRRNQADIIEEELWRRVIIEEAARRRQPGKGSQEEAARRRHQETPRRRQEAAPKGSQEATRSVFLSVSASVPILLLLLCVFKGPRCLRAARQRLRDPRWPKVHRWQDVIVQTWFLSYFYLSLLKYYTHTQNIEQK